MSRLVTSHRESRSESFIRRGLAAIFEHGFISTEEGRAQYFLTLAQIARAVQEVRDFFLFFLLPRLKSKSFSDDQLWSHLRLLDLPQLQQDLGGAPWILPQADAARALGARVLHVGHCRQDGAR